MWQSRRTRHLPVRGSDVPMSWGWKGLKRSPSPSSSAPKRPATPTRRTINPSRISRPRPNCMSPSVSGGVPRPRRAVARPGHAVVNGVVEARSRQPVAEIGVAGQDPADAVHGGLYGGAVVHGSVGVPARCQAVPRTDQAAGSSARERAAVTRADTRSSRTHRQQLVDQLEHRGVRSIGVPRDRMHGVGSDGIDGRLRQTPDGAERRTQEPHPPGVLHVLGP